MLGCMRSCVGNAARRVASAAPMQSLGLNSGGIMAAAERLGQTPSAWSKSGGMMTELTRNRGFSTLGAGAAGINGVFGLMAAKGLIGSKVAAGERSVGTVHRGKLRGNIREAWEHREIERLTAARDPSMFDDFDVGDQIVVRHVDVDSPGRYLTFGGVCIAKYGGNKLMRSFRLRNHVDGVGVEVHFLYYAPHIKGIQLLKKKTRATKRAKWYFLRDKPPKEYTVTWKEKELKLPRPAK